MEYEWLHRQDLCLVLYLRRTPSIHLARSGLRSSLFLVERPPGRVTYIHLRQLRSVPADLPECHFWLLVCHCLAVSSQLPLSIRPYRLISPRAAVLAPEYNFAVPSAGLTTKAVKTKHTPKTSDRASVSNAAKMRHVNKAATP